MKYKDFHATWFPILYNLNSPELKKLFTEILPNISYQPKREDIFKTFTMSLNDIKVVILGQDPYFTPNTCIGYAFDVKNTDKIPFSLKIINREIKRSLPENQIHLSENTDTRLQHLQEQGVFLLNTALTVKTGVAGSHTEYWKNFTQNVIKYISFKRRVVWILFGKKAFNFIPYIYKPVIVEKYSKKTIINMPVIDNNYIIKTSHPAAEAYKSNAGFIGSNCFYFTNIILKKQHLPVVKW